MLEYGVEGVIDEIVSDNGSQFTGADFAAIKHHYPGIRHHLIPVGSPSHGGFYEIRHRDVKRVITTALVERPLSHWVELAALAEFKVNSNRDGSYPSAFALIHGREPESRVDRIHRLIVDVDADRLSGSRVTRDKSVKIFKSLQKTLDEFNLLCEDQFRQSRLEVALQRKLSRRPELEVGVEVLVRSRKSVKHDPKWHHEVYTVKEVFNSQVTVQDGSGYEQTFALKDVKRYGGAPNPMGDDISEAEADVDYQGGLDDLCGAEGEDTGEVATTGANQSSGVSQDDPPISSANQTLNKRSRKPSFKQVMLDVEKELSKKRRRKEGK
jgi:hypothetical protein